MCRSAAWTWKACSREKKGFSDAKTGGKTSLLWQRLVTRSPLGQRQSAEASSNSRQLRLDQSLGLSRRSATRPSLPNSEQLGHPATDKMRKREKRQKKKINRLSGETH